MLKQSNIVSRNIDITWKTFVRESCEVSTVSPEKKVDRLAFRGNEAREAYEEIINEESDTKSKNEPTKRFNSRTSINSNKTNVLNSKSKDNQCTREKVSINSVLKAVEQKDLNFLSIHMTKENVNLSDDFGWTPLMSAAYCGHIDIVEFLLNLGANKMAREKSGLTAAQLALKKNYLSIVALFKKRREIMTNEKLSNIGLNDLKGNREDALQRGKDLAQPSDDCTKSIGEKNDNTEVYVKEDTGFYCKICNANFCQTTWKKHETSTLHIFNTKPKLPSAVYGISKQNKGYQMLLNHGWDDHAGLGPSGRGIKYPIKTCLKLDRRGLGQANEKDYRVTHFKPGDLTAIADLRAPKSKCFKKKDREKLLNREARKERALRIALS